FTWRLDPLLVVYDCMDEPPYSVSGKSGESAPPGAKQREAELLKLADLVFTSGDSLYEARRRLHHNIHPFPAAETQDASAWDYAWASMMDLINLTFKNRYSCDRG